MRGSRGQDQSVVSAPPIFCIQITLAPRRVIHSHSDPFFVVDLAIWSCSGYDPTFCDWRSPLERFSCDPRTWGLSSNVFAPLFREGGLQSWVGVSPAIPPQNHRSRRPGGKHKVDDQEAGASRFQQFTQNEQGPIEGRNIPVCTPLFQLTGC